MIPLRDVIPSRTVPVITVTLIVLNAVAWFYEISLPERQLAVFLQHYGVVPADFSPATLVTSMFLHGGWMHLGGNMLYLWIFGDNLERVMGAARYAVFYIVCGIAAGLAHILFAGGSAVPSVGASGAISGVLGGYLLMFPQNRVKVLMRGGVASVPAIVVLGLWIVIQLVSQLGSIAETSQGGGIAYMAHIGGFVAGMALVKLFATRQLATA